MAGAGYKTFTAGEVLTASDVNTFLMQQSVQNYGGTAARSSAIPSPSTGMVSYIGDDGNGVSQIQAYNGSSWNTMGGLVLVKTQTIGTGVSSVTVTGAFSATYDAYKIIVSGGIGSTDTAMSVQLGNSPTFSTSTYKYYLQYVNFGGSTGAASSNGDSQFTNSGYVTTNFIDLSFNLINPYLAKYSIIKDASWNFGSGTGFYNGLHATATSYADLKIQPTLGTLTGGTIAVYGYRKA